MAVAFSKSEAHRHRHFSNDRIMQCLQLVPRAKRRTVLRNPSELERVEALLDAMADRMGKGSRATAAKLIGIYDRDRRDKARAKRDPTFTASTRTGPIRAREIDALLEAAGWTLREFVDRKLPLLRLPDNLKRLLLEERLEPSKALLLGRVKNREARVSLTSRVLAGMTQQALSRELYGTPLVDTALQADLEYLPKEATRTLGTRVIVGSKSITIECFSGHDPIPKGRGLSFQISSHRERRIYGTDDDRLQDFSPFNVRSIS